jgi:hypothetical protein
MRWKGPPSPAVPAVRSLGPRIRGTRHHRSAEPRRTPVDSVPASSEGAFRGGSPVGWTLSRTPASRCSLSRTPGPLCSLTLRFPLEPGHPLWWRAKFVSLPKGLRKRLEEPIFKILCDGSAHPQERLRYPQGEARCPPVVHQFIHTGARVLLGTTVRRRGEMAEGTGPTERITPRQFHQSAGVDGWRVLGDGVRVLPHRSFAAGARGCGASQHRVEPRGHGTTCGVQRLR